MAAAAASGTATTVLSRREKPAFSHFPVTIPMFLADIKNVCPSATEELQLELRSALPAHAGAAPIAHPPGAAGLMPLASAVCAKPSPDAPRQWGPVSGPAPSATLSPPHIALPERTAPPPCTELFEIDFHVDAQDLSDSQIRPGGPPVAAPPALITPRHTPGEIPPAFPPPADTASFPVLDSSLRARVTQAVSSAWLRIDRRRLLVMIVAAAALVALSPTVSSWLRPAEPRRAEATPQPIGSVSGSRTPTDSGADERRWAALEQWVAHRAGVLWTEDFRSGFENWQSRGDISRSWRFDETGFVLPTELAVYRPSADMTDYTMEFLGEADRRALSWAFRVRDLKNYYAAKLIVTRPGPLPLISLRRYMVINGRETAARETVLPITVRGGSMCQVHMEVKGSDFAVHVQDRLVGFWSDSRIPAGGVGFFSNKGEISRIRWLHVAHQYDVLGRICAYLSPSVNASNSNRPFGVGNHGQR